MSLKNNKTMVTFMLLLVAFIWGTGFIATKFAIDANYSSGFIMMFRFTVASIIMGVVFYKEIRKMKLSCLKGGIISGIALFLGFTFQTYGLEYSTPSNNAFVTASNIVLVPFLVWAIYKKRPPLKIFIAAIVCFVGVFLLSIDFKTGISNFGFGELLTFFAAISFAVHTTSISYFAEKMNTTILNFLQLSVSSILSIILFFVVDGDISQLSFKVPLLSILYLAVFSTCIAYFIQTKAQKYASAGKTAVIIATESLFASVFSVILGYDKLNQNLIIGGSLILLSVILTEVDFKFRKPACDEV